MTETTGVNTRDILRTAAGMMQTGIEVGAKGKALDGSQLNTEEKKIIVDGADWSSKDVRGKLKPDFDDVIGRGGFGNKIEGYARNENGDLVLGGKALLTLLWDDAILAGSEWNEGKRGELTKAEQLLGLESDQTIEMMESGDVLSALTQKLKLSDQNTFERESTKNTLDKRGAEYGALMGLQKALTGEYFGPDGDRPAKGYRFSASDLFLVDRICPQQMERAVYVGNVVARCAEKLQNPGTSAEDRLSANLALQLAQAEREALVATLRSVYEVVRVGRERASSKNALVSLVNRVGMDIELTFQRRTGTMPQIEGVEMPDRKTLDQMRRDFLRYKDYDDRSGKAVEFITGVKYASDPKSKNDNLHAKYVRVLCWEGDGIER